MPYNKSKLEKVLLLIEEHPKTLNMKAWLTAPDGKSSSPFYALCDGSFNSDSLKYSPPECGTSMCLAGFMCHAFIQELVEKGDDLNKYSSLIYDTPRAALAYVGIVKDEENCSVYSGYYDYKYEFEKVFSRLRIRTVGGLRKALKQQGLL